KADENAPSDPWPARSELPALPKYRGEKQDDEPGKGVGIDERGKNPITFDSLEVLFRIKLLPIRLRVKGLPRSLKPAVVLIKADQECVEKANQHRCPEPWTGPGSSQDEPTEQQRRSATDEMDDGEIGELRLNRPRAA